MKRIYLCALVVALALALLVAPLAGAQGWLQRFENVLIEGNAMLVDGYMTIGNGTPSTAQTNESLYVEGTLEVDGTANIGSVLTLGNGLVIGSIVQQSSVTITPTAGQTILPAYGVYLIGSSAEVSITLAACATPGQIVTLVGKDNNNITVNDTNVYTHDGSAEVFAQYDVSQWICVGTKWYQLGLTAADS